MTVSHARLRTGLRVFCASVACVTLGLLLHTALVSDDAALLYGGPAPFVMAPGPVSTQLRAIPATGPRPQTFVRRFDVEVPGAARITLRGLRRVSAELNGSPIELAGDPESWRSLRTADVGHRLRAGRNELRVTVANPSGPPVLQVALELGDRTLLSDASWRVIGAGPNPVDAVLADDTLAHPDSQLLAEPGHVMRQRAVALSAAMLAILALTTLVERLRPAWWTRHRARIVIGAAIVFWGALFIFKMTALPAVIGFDAPAHLHYIELVRNEGRIPLANEGFSTYHPPLFHAATAALATLFKTGPNDASAAVVFRLIPFLSGALCVLFALLTARALWPGDRVRQLTTLALAATLPVNLYMAGTLSNEPLHAACVSAALYAGVHLILSKRAGARGLAALALALGLGLLTKFTSLMLAPIVLAAVAAKIYASEARSRGDWALGVVGVVGVMAVIAGWFYARNLYEFGDPVVWNLDVPGAPSWWLQPGFHTPAWYTSFGEGIRHPVFAGFRSFWDGVYSTFWGDGLVSGMASASTRHGLWNEDFMLIGYWLAWPMTAALAIGWLRGVRSATRVAAGDDRRALALALLATVTWALAASLLLITLRLPFYAQAKAPYVLAGFVPIVLFMADGFVWMTERPMGSAGRFVRPLLWAWLCALVAAIAFTYLG